MKFKDLNIGNYFCFEKEGGQGRLICRKMANNKIRKYEVREATHYFKEVEYYFKNEVILDLGPNIYQFSAEIHLKKNKKIQLRSLA